MSDTATHLAYLGTYTDGDSEGVYRYRVDASTGEMDRLGATEAGENPTFLAVHPSGDYLYAVNEAGDGGAVAFEVDRETGDLERLNERPTGDAGPCHCSVDAAGEYLLVAHYGGGSVSMLPVGADGALGDPTDVVEHEGSSVGDRQTEPHPHSINPGPDDRFAYVPDLGTDEVVAYELDREADALERVGATEVHDGAGPRHLDFHPAGRYAYLINELDSTLTALERDPETGALEAVETVETLPPEFDGESYTADVHVHPSGSFVYGSNRGHDSIVAFECDAGTGRLSLVGHESTRGEWPRNFALDPSGDHLFAENRDTDDVVAFDVDGATGELSATGDVEAVPSPVCMQFLADRD